MLGPNRYLRQLGPWWHYVRVVPAKARAVEGRRRIGRTLRTQCVAEARQRRDEWEKSDNERWAAFISSKTPTQRFLETVADREHHDQFLSAKDAAQALGFPYVPMSRLVEDAPVEELARRLEALDAFGLESETNVSALLGGEEPPPIKLYEAFELYCDEIAIDDQIGKSPAQLRNWKRIKLLAVKNFIRVIGNKPIAEITREDARVFFNWWAERISPDSGAKRVFDASTARRDIGNLRKLYREYFKFLGDDARSNPFRNLSFSENSAGKRPVFSDEWVRERLLKPRILLGVNREAVLAMYALIETGARASEIVNLRPEDIHLDAEVPYISIRQKRDREVKTKSSIRDIPLVGVSLEAMRLAPNGFPRYLDRSELLSKTLLGAFRRRGLFPTDAHVIYSFRHSFEKRMQEANLDYGLRCLLMGHKTNRPAYGDGGSLAYRREELLKFAHPYPEGVLRSYFPQLEMAL